MRTLLTMIAVCTFTLSLVFLQHHPVAYGQTAAQNSIKLKVWVLGQTLGLAAVDNANGAAPGLVMNEFRQAQAQAKALGVTLPSALPSRAANKAKDTLNCYNYIEDGIAPVYKSIFSKHGEGAGSLFETSTKAKLLLLMYSPGDLEGIALNSAFKRAADDEVLPAKLLKPLTDAVDHKASRDEVKRCVTTLDFEVRRLYSGGK